MQLIAKLKYHLSRTPLRRPFYWYRHRDIVPADVFIVCFPRAGSTWLRFLLCGLVTEGDAGFEEVYRVIPALGGQKDAPRVLPGGGRLGRTHESYRSEYKKAIYLIRDPRDVLVSNYNYLRGREFFSGTIEDFIEPFFAGKLYGYGEWRGHVEAWLNSPLNGDGKLLPVRYEDLRERSAETLASICEFLGIEASPERIRDTLARNSLDQMKGKESKARATTFRDYPGGFRFVRQGSVGSWGEALSAENIRRVEEYAGELMERFEYETTGGVVQTTAQGVLAGAD